MKIFLTALLFCYFYFLVFRNSCFIRIIWVVTPFEPATIVNRNIGPSHEPCIEPCFASAPAGTAIKSQMFIGCYSLVFPYFSGFMKFACGVVEISVVFHVVSIRATISKDGSRYSSFCFDVIVSAYFSYIFGITTYTNQLCIIGFQHFFGFGRINSQLWMSRNFCTKLLNRIFGFVGIRNFISFILPRLKTTI